jgi:hypothetical protein
MKKKTIGILATSVAVCALCVMTDGSAFAGGGGHGGGGVEAFGFFQSHALADSRHRSSHVLVFRFAAAGRSTSGRSNSCDTMTTQDSASMIGHRLGIGK